MGTLSHLQSKPKTLKRNFKRSSMEEELIALDINHTRDLVTKSLGVNIVVSKWIYRIKTNEDGTIDRFKAHLVSRGFT